MNNYLIGIEGMKSMLNEIEKPMDSFKKKYYEKNFNLAYQKCLPVFGAIEEVYNSVKEPETLIQNMSQALVDTALEKVNACTKKVQKESVMMDMNLTMAVFIFPAILMYKGNSSQPLVDQLLADWKKAFPKSNLQAADFEFIEKGFHKKFCYITTAVCETFHKPDNCYELTLLRDYRDGYLAGLPEGERVIRAYYDVAPTIVKHINQREDSFEIYEGIWQRYLAPCISMIEAGQNEACKDLYIEMVETLQKKYFYLQ